MDAANLAERMAEPWFDPAGLLVAERRTAGCSASTGPSSTPPELGEVYVVGVDPAAQGRGLGRILTLAGLTTSRPRASRRSCSTSSPTTRRRSRVYRDARVHARRPRHPRAVRRR